MTMSATCSPTKIRWSGGFSSIGSSDYSTNSLISSPTRELPLRPFPLRSSYASSVIDISGLVYRNSSLMLAETESDSSRCRIKKHEFVAHGSAVTCLALDHHSGQLMITGGDDAKINVWSIGKPNCLMSLNGHRTSVECAKFHHNQDIIGAGSTSGAIKLWDLKEAKLMQTLIGHKTNVRCIDFHPYGQFMTSGSFDTNIKLWDYRKKGCVGTYRAHAKEVHCLKMSPDGRWIASGGNEGNIVIYDIVAGKIIAELKGHGASITDVVFHPEEFLLSSSSLDGTVKFWDLEQNQLISSSSYSSNMGPIRKIGFHPSGKALCASGRDCLKVFNWEPTKVLDTVKVTWGRPNDVAVLDQQLISCSYSTTNVSVFVVDLANVSPFGCPSARSTRESPLKKNTRKSFSRNDRKSVKVLESIDSIDPSDVHSSSGDDDLSFAEVHSQDYKIIFNSRRELVRTPPLDSGISSEDVSLIDIPGKVETLDKILTPNMSKSFSHHSFTSASGKRISPTMFTSSSTIHGLSESMNSLNMPLRTNSGNQSNNSSLNISRYSIAPNMNVNCARQLSPLRTQPTVNSPMKATSVVKPQVSGAPRTRGCSTDSLTISRSKNMTSDYELSNFDFNDFLPKHFLTKDETILSDNQVIESVMSGHRQIIVGLDYRFKQMQVILLKWAKEPRVAVEYAIGLDQISIVVDLLNVMILKASMWTLDICLLLLPTILDLLENKYESYVKVGCSSLTLIVKTFGGTIKGNVSGGPLGIGVDITREERHNKCKSCYDMLLRARAFILKRQTVSGVTGRVFRNLLPLMDNLV